MAGKRKNPALPRHDLPVFERIRERIRETEEEMAASIARHGDQAGLKAKTREIARAAQAILAEDLTVILNVLDKHDIDPNAFIWCAFIAHTPEGTLKLLIDRRDAARHIRERIRELAAELAKAERKACNMGMRGVSEEHAKALEGWAAGVNVPLTTSVSTEWAIKSAALRLGKATYLRAFMMLLTEHRVMPHDVLAVRYEEDRLIPNLYDAVIARMASVVLGDEVTITEVRSARKEFGMTIRTWTEPPST